MLRHPCQVGAPRWLSCIVTTWGLTAMSFAFSACALRCLLHLPACLPGRLLPHRRARQLLLLHVSLCLSNIHTNASCACCLLNTTCLCQTTVKNRTQFFVLRLLLGMSESGAFPAMWHYLNSFYPADQVTVPFSLIEAAVGFANVCGAPLAAGLLMLDGAQGWHGWQW